MSRNPSNEQVNTLKLDSEYSTYPRNSLFILKKLLIQEIPSQFTKLNNCKSRYFLEVEESQWSKTKIWSEKTKLNYTPHKKWSQLFFKKQQITLQSPSNKMDKKLIRTVIRNTSQLATPNVIGLHSQVKDSIGVEWNVTMRYL